MPISQIKLYETDGRQSITITMDDGREYVVSSEGCWHWLVGRKAGMVFPLPLDEDAIHFHESFTLETGYVVKGGTRDPIILDLCQKMMDRSMSGDDVIVYPKEE